MHKTIVALTLAIAQLGAQERFEFKEMHMGMEVRIVLYASDQVLARSAARRAFNRIDELENIMSDFRSESELRRLERRAGEWVAASRELIAVLTYALDVAAKTNGAFDPTVGPIVHLWRDARRTLQLPNKRAIDSARALVGWRRIELDLVRDRVRIAAGTRLDLGGIAKGYIVQAAVREMRAHDISALVEAGGDIAVGGVPPSQSGWTIAAADTSIVLSHGALSTSGPQAQFVEIAGTRYSHVVDPRTGMALTSAYTATVLHGNGMLADALATALTVMGPDGSALVRRHYPDAIVQVRRVHGQGRP